MPPFNFIGAGIADCIRGTQANLLAAVPAYFQNGLALDLTIKSNVIIVLNIPAPEIVVIIFRHHQSPHPAL